MATREAAIRVSLKQGEFRTGLKQMVNDSATAGKQMSKAMSTPLNTGMKAAQASFTGLAGSVKNTIGMALKFGGAFGFAAIIRNTLQMQTQFRDLAHIVNKVPGNMVKWEQLQAMISERASKTGQSTSAMADAFKTVFETTGNLEYAKSAIEAIGNVATASGKDVGEFARIPEVLADKWKATGDNIGEYMTVFDQMTGRGGVNAEEMGRKFTMLAGEAANAGMTGTKGFGDLLAMIGMVGEKTDEAVAIPGIKKMLQAVRDGSPVMRKLAKDSHIKFGAEEGPLERIKKIMGSDKGQKVFKASISGDLGAMFKGLAEPYDKAEKAALAAGATEKQAREVAVAAFNKNIDDAGAQTKKYADIQKEVSSRRANDPALQLEEAMRKIQKAFAKPQMVAAIEKVAEKLPVMAEWVASFAGWAMENPGRALGLALIAKVGGAAATATMSTMIGNMLKGSGGIPGAVGGAMGGGGGIAGVAGMTGLAGAGGPVGGVIKGGKVVWEPSAWQPVPTGGLMAKMTATGMTAGQTFAGAATAAIIGYEIGGFISDWLEAANNKVMTNKENETVLSGEVKQALKPGATIEEKKKVLGKVGKATDTVMREGLTSDKAIGNVKAFFGGDFSKSGTGQDMKRLSDLSSEELALRASINSGNARIAKEQDVIYAALSAQTEKLLKEFKPGSHRGTRGASHSQPGSHPVKG